jgi:hypothetical protein
MSVAVRENIAAKFGSSECSDCTIVFRQSSDGAEVGRLPALVLIVCSGSQVLKDILESTMASCKPDVPLQVDEQWQVEALTRAIKYMYTGSVDADDMRRLVETWWAADFLHVTGCMESCVNEIVSLLSKADDIEQFKTLRDAVRMLPGKYSDAASEPFSGIAQAAVKKLTSLAHTGDWSEILLFFVGGNVLNILNNGALRKVCMRMPASQLVKILTSDSLATDSEESIVMFGEAFLERAKRHKVHGVDDEVRMAYRLDQLQNHTFFSGVHGVSYSVAAWLSAASAYPEPFRRNCYQHVQQQSKIDFTFGLPIRPRLGKLELLWRISGVSWSKRKTGVCSWTSKDPRVKLDGVNKVVVSGVEWTVFVDWEDSDGSCKPGLVLKCFPPSFMKKDYCSFPLLVDAAFEADSHKDGDGNPQVYQIRIVFGNGQLMFKCDDMEAACGSKDITGRLVFDTHFKSADNSDASKKRRVVE